MGHGHVGMLIYSTVAYVEKSIRQVILGRWYVPKPVQKTEFVRNISAREKKKVRLNITTSREATECLGHFYPVEVPE